MLPLAAALSRHFSVLNYGYKTRSLLLHEHAESLLDSVRTRTESAEHPRIHFVTHSFGGVVLRAAFGAGLRDLLPSASRCALIAPPLRGAVVARTLELMDFRGPDLARRALRGATRVVMGENSGMELRKYGPEWFERAGEFPRDAELLVVEGAMGRINPMVGSESDGIVGACETMMERPHYRLSVGLTHNMLCMSPSVVSAVSHFIRGETIGEIHPGKPLLSQESP